MAHPQAVKRRQLAKARATNARDRMLAKVTYGPVGGISGGLGALNTATNTVGGLTGGARRPTIVKGGPIEGGGQTGIQIAANYAGAIPPRTIILPPVPPVNPPGKPVVMTGNVTAALNALPGIKVLGQPTPPKKPLPGKKLPGSRPAPTPTPLPEPSGTAKPPPNSSGGSSGGGGGGGGGSSGSSAGGGALVPDYEPDELPDIDDVATQAPTTTSSSMSTGTKVAVGVGIAAALYFLLQGDK